MATRTIFLLGGGGYAIDFDAQLDDWWLGLAGVERPRVALIPTATGDALHEVDKFVSRFKKRTASIAELRLFNREVTDFDAFLGDADVVYVLGGNTANLLAVWRAQGLDRALRAAYDRGVVLGGVSAGAICWGLGGTTDSFGGMDVLRDGLGFVPHSVSPHHDTGGRRALFEAAVADGRLPGGYGIDNGAGILFRNGQAVEIVSPRPWAKVRHTALGGTETLPVTILK